jgi:hypothetical protein
MIRGMESGHQKPSPARYGAWISLGLGAVIVLFALAAITWATSWTTTDLITGLIFGAVLIALGTTTDLAGRYIDTRGPKDDAAKATESPRTAAPSLSRSPGLKKVLDEEQHRTVEAAFKTAGYPGRLMIASAPSSAEVFVILQPDQYADWKFSDEQLAQFEQYLARQLESEVRILGTSRAWPAPPAISDISFSS